MIEMKRISPFKGKKHSEEAKRKNREAHIGFKHSKESRKKISDGLRGRKHSEETKRKIGKANKGKTSWKKGIKEGENHKPKFHTKETKKKIRESLKGEKSHLWKGGISFEPYSLEWDETLREVIRNRDRRKCQICRKTELENKRKLAVHHIDYDKKNCNPNNLITLCHICHIKTNHKREYWLEYFKK